MSCALTYLEKVNEHWNTLGVLLKWAESGNVGVSNRSKQGWPKQDARRYEPAERPKHVLFYSNQATS